MPSAGSADSLTAAVQTFKSCTSRPDGYKHLRLYKHLWITSQKIKPSTSLTHAACETKLRSFVRSSMYQYLGNWVANGRAVVYHARAQLTHLMQELNAGTAKPQLIPAVVEDPPTKTHFNFNHGNTHNHRNKIITPQYILRN